MFHGRKHFVLRRNIGRDNRGPGACLLEDAIIVTRMGIPLARTDCAPGPDRESSARSGEVCSIPAARRDRYGGCR
ncbi:hypothetical protein MPLSOD_40600 [Mesorhizobium sp. SOD10]|nr:hypothetical protein MPLSOD_40600 [Mesorhizobium sp. SOD10]